MRAVPDRVECYSGGAYAEDPVKFFWEGHWRTVGRIVARSRLPGEKRFEAEDETGARFVLTYFPERDEWSVRAGE